MVTLIIPNTSSYLLFRWQSGGKDQPLDPPPRLAAVQVGGVEIRPLQLAPDLVRGSGADRGRRLEPLLDRSQEFLAPGRVDRLGELEDLGAGFSGQRHRRTSSRYPPRRMTTFPAFCSST